jgi:hypothetical protein
MANEMVALLRYAKVRGLGWRRGLAVIGKTGKVTPNQMLLGKQSNKQKVDAPDGHYVLRYFDGRLPRYKKLGNDPTEALDELSRARKNLKLKNAANAAGYIIPAPVPVKRKSLAEHGREFLEQKRSPSLKLAEDTIKLYTVVVEEFVTVCGKTLPEDITEADVIHYCNQLDKLSCCGSRSFL